MFECVFESVSEGERCSLQVRSGSVFARQCHRSLGSPSELPSERGLPTNLRRGTPGSARTVVQSTEQTGGGGHGLPFGERVPRELAGERQWGTRRPCARGRSLGVARTQPPLSGPVRGQARAPRSLPVQPLRRVPQTRAV